MLFSGGSYYAFLIVVFFLFWSVAERPALRVLLLVVASYAFFSPGGWLPLAVLASVSTLDYTTTRLMARTERAGARRALLLVSLVADIGALAVFKYANFILESASSALALAGVTVRPAQLGFVGTVAISFFVFQSIGYVMDVYRRDAPPAAGYLDYLAFVSFFPTIIAGPILRAKDLLPRLRERVALDAETGGQALFLIAVGLVKKIAIADYLAANFVDRVFDFPGRFSTLEVLAGVYGYALQIYADFSGYSDIAIGSALLLGFALPENFNLPYRSRGLPEFWRRWHISLSNWLRDYVFFSIVGRRSRSMALMYFGLIATMLIGGLWHGASWTFVIWGLLHGVGLAVARWYAMLRTRWRRRNPENLLERLPAALTATVATLATFHFVCLTWIFFRADGLDAALGLLACFKTWTTDTSNLPLAVIGVIAVGYASHWVPEAVFARAGRTFARLPSFVQASALFAVAVGLYYVASSDVVPFIYARF